MSNDDGHDVAGLVALGIVVLIGMGLYKVIKSFGSLESGEEVTKEELAEAMEEQSGEEEYRRIIKRRTFYSQNYVVYENDVCNNCGTVLPYRCEEADHCRVCIVGDGNSECSNCGKCIGCRSHAGGGVCNWCD